MVQKLAEKTSGKLVVGLTGGFGSGKSTVAEMFRELGACVIDADRLVHEALRKGSPVYDEVARIFKKTAGVTTAEGLDRKKIATVVFKDPKERKKLEAVLHRYVFQRMLCECGEAREAVAVLEIPLLFETGFDQYCHRTVAVWAPEGINTRRLLKKGFSLGDILARRKAQFSAREKARRADIVIDNSKTAGATRRQVEAAWKKFIISRKETHPVNVKGKGKSPRYEKK